MSTPTTTINLAELQQEILAELQQAEQALERAQAQVWLLRGKLDLIARLAQASQEAPPAT